MRDIWINRGVIELRRNRATNRSGSFAACSCAAEDVVAGNDGAAVIRRFPDQMRCQGIPISIKAWWFGHFYRAAR